MGEPVKKYRIYCQTDNQWEYIWNTSVPSTCPINAGHTVNTDSVAEMGRVIRYAKLDNTDSPYSILNHNWYWCDTSSGNLDINLPGATGINYQRTFIFQKRSANNLLSINATNGDTIGGSTGTYTLSSDLETLKIESGGNNWTLKNIGTSSYEEPRNIDGQIYMRNYAKGQILVNNNNDFDKVSGQVNQILESNSSTLGVGFTGISMPDAGWLTAIKTTAEQRLDIGLTGDADLTLPIGANENMYLDGVLFMQRTGGNGQIRIAWDIPTGANMRICYVLFNSNSVATQQIETTDLAPQSVALNAGSDKPLFVRGIIFNGPNAGNVALAWDSTSSSITMQINSHSFLRGFKF